MPTTRKYKMLLVVLSTMLVAASASPVGNSARFKRQNPEDVDFLDTPGISSVPSITAIPSTGIVKATPSPVAPEVITTPVAAPIPSTSEVSKTSSAVTKPTATPPPPAASTSTEPEKTGLSPAAIGGIVGGAIFVGLTVLSVVFFILWKRRRERRRSSQGGFYEGGKDFKKVANDSSSDFGNIEAGRDKPLPSISPAPGDSEFLPPIKSITPLPLKPFTKSPSPPPAAAQHDRKGSAALASIQQIQEQSREVPPSPGFANTQFNVPRPEYNQPRQVPTYNPQQYAAVPATAAPQVAAPVVNPYVPQPHVPYAPPQLQQTQQYRTPSPQSGAIAPPPPKYDSPPSTAPHQQAAIHQTRSREPSVSSVSSWPNAAAYDENIPAYPTTSKGSGLPPLNLPAVPEIRTQLPTPRTPQGNKNGGDVSPVSPLSTSGFDFFGNGNNSTSQGRPETIISQQSEDGIDHGIGLALIPPTPNPEGEALSPLSFKRSSNDSLYSFRGSGPPPLDPAFPLPPGISTPEPNPQAEVVSNVQRAGSVVWRQNINAAAQEAVKEIVGSEQKAKKKRPAQLNLVEGGDSGRLGSPSFWKGLRSPRSPGKAPK